MFVWSIFRNLNLLIKFLKFWINFCLLYFMLLVLVIFELMLIIIVLVLLISEFNFLIEFNVSILKVF